MERGYRSSKKIEVANGRGNVGVSKLDVAECRDMDQQLAQVASAKFSDMHSGLLDEIFQSAYFEYLLGIRRVCKSWNGAISRRSAPFVRNVILSTDFFGRSRSKNFWKIGGGACQFWLFVEDATTLMVCGTVEKVLSYDPRRPLNGLLGSYQHQQKNRTNQAPLRIKKAIYANMLVDSDYFQFPAFRRVGFQTVLYRCTLKLVIGDIFPYKENRQFSSPCFSDGVDVMLKVANFDSYSLKEADLEQMNKTWTSFFSDKRFFSPVAEQFARKNCTHLPDWQLVLLTDGTFVKHIRSVEVQDMVKQLINSFDPGNEKALNLYDKGDVVGFAKAAHPLVSVLLHRFLQYDTDCYFVSDYEDGSGSCDNSDGDWYDND